MHKLTRRATLGLLAAPAFLREVSAQTEWPNRPVRLVVAFAAGGAADTAARTVGAKVQEIIGQSVVIENRTGGNAVVAASAVLGAPKDGYTFLVDAANQLTNPVLMRDLTFDYRTTWQPVSQICSFSQVVAVKSDFPARSWAEFVAYLKSHPNEVSCGTPPAAGMAHLALERIQRMADVRLVHTPYRGGADAARDIMAGVIDSVLITTNSIKPPQQAGKARLLALTSAQRNPAQPDLPTLDELGLRGFDMDDWNGIFAAQGVPEAIQEKLQRAVAEAARDAGVKQRMDPLGATLVGNTGAQFKAWLEAQRPIIEQLIRDADIRLG